MATYLARHEWAPFGDLAESVVRNTIVNAVLSTTVDEQNNTHPPSLTNHSSDRTVSLADRAALHLGLALITWSRRPRAVASPVSWDELRARRAASAAREAREREWQRALYLSQARR